VISTTLLNSTHYPNLNLIYDTQPLPTTSKPPICTATMADTNKKQYIYLPETTPHLATILSFPSRASTFPALYNQTCTEIIDLAATIAHFEPVRLHVRPEDQDRAQELLTKRLSNTTTPTELEQSRITLIPAPTNHIWVRDTGPMYVRSAEDPTERHAIDFQFCEWGNSTGELLYNPSPDKKGALPDGSDWPMLDAERRRENAAFATRVLELEGAGVPRVISKVRLEGGGIEMDGEGTFMAMESSVTVSSRNAGLSRSEIETELSRLLGVSTFIWIPGREGLDITDYHIDAEARFIRGGVVVVGKPHQKCKKVFWDVYHEMRAILDEAVDACGRKLEVIDIQEPDPTLVQGDVPGEETDVAASYVNFYFTNGGLVVPAFGDVEMDRRALETLQGLVPEREVRQVAVNALPRTGGVLHCTTQQVI
jgi:agmatine deiminase